MNLGYIIQGLNWYSTFEEEAVKNRLDNTHSEVVEFDL